MRDGAFSTQYRYIRERASGTWGLVAGATCAANVQNAGHFGDAAVRPAIYWRFECGAYVCEKPRATTWTNNAGTLISQTLVAPVVTGSVTEVAAP